MSPPTRPRYGPVREELFQLDSTYNREPQWPFGSRAEFEMKQGLIDRENARKPHTYGIVDARGDACGKYRAAPKWSFRPVGRPPRRPELKPGPGGYTPRDAPVTRRSPSAGFGASGGRCGLEWEGSDSPGPGVYDCRGSLGGPAPPMPGRGSARTAGGGAPGPGAYSPAPHGVCGIPNFGKPLEGRPRSAGPPPRQLGPMHPPFGSDAKRYTFGARRPEKIDGTRRLAGNYTQFGHHGK